MKARHELIVRVSTRVVVVVVLVVAQPDCPPTLVRVPQRNVAQVAQIAT